MAAIGTSRQKRAGWRDYHEKLGGKAGSVNPIVDPFDSSLKSGLRTCLSERRHFGSHIDRGVKITDASFENVGNERCH